MHILETYWKQSLMFWWELHHIRTLTQLSLANWEMTKQMKKEKFQGLKRWDSRGSLHSQVTLRHGTLSRICEGSQFYV